MLSYKVSDLEYMSLGFIDQDLTRTASSIIKIRPDGTIMRKLGSVDLRSLPIIYNKRQSIKPAEIPSLNEVCSYIYSMSLGARVTKPPFQTPYLDRPFKSFFSSKYSPSALITIKNAYYTESYYNYIVMNRWNPRTGVVEHIMREYRQIQATLALLLKRSIAAAKTHKQPCPDVLPQNAVGNLKHVEIGLEAWNAIISNLRSDENILAFLDGIAVLCCWNDHSINMNDEHSKKLRRWMGDKTETLMDGEPQPAERFFTDDNICFIMSIGNHGQDLLYIVPDNEDKVIETMSDEENNGENRYFHYYNENKIPDYKGQSISNGKTYAPCFTVYNTVEEENDASESDEDDGEWQI